MLDCTPKIHLFQSRINHKKNVLCFQNIKDKRKSNAFFIKVHNFSSKISILTFKDYRLVFHSTGWMFWVSGNAPKEWSTPWHFEETAPRWSPYHWFYYRSSAVRKWTPYIVHISSQIPRILSCITEMSSWEALRWGSPAVSEVKTFHQEKK